MSEKYLFTLIVLIIIIILLLFLFRLKSEYKNKSLKNTLNDEGTVPIEELQEIIPKITIQTPTFEKKIVPPYIKITKENFKEFSGLRILIAEDNIINQKVIQGLLADTNISLVMANDGQEVLDILAKDTNFFMILMDAHMPNMDGYEATKIIRTIPEYNKIPIIAFSGDIALDDIKKMKDAGMQDHIEKPLKIASLYDILYAYNIDTSPRDINPSHELNIEYGLEVCGNDKEFYKELLNDFITMYENSTHQLGIYIYSYRLKQADEYLLDIIGITANLGANSLNSIAQDIKTALKEQEGKSFISLVEQYKVQFDSLVIDIKKYGV